VGFESATIDEIRGLAHIYTYTGCHEVWIEVLTEFD